MPLDPSTDPSPLQIFISATIIGGLAGFASALRSTSILTGRYVGSAVLTAGLTGLITALIGHAYVHESNNIYFLLGVSGLAGYGGATLLDAALAVLIRFVGSKGDTFTSTPGFPGKPGQTAVDSKEGPKS